MLYIYLFENIFLQLDTLKYRKTTRNCIDYIKTETLYHYVFYSEKKKLVIYCNMTKSMKHIGNF